MIGALRFWLFPGAGGGDEFVEEGDDTHAGEVEGAEGHDAVGFFGPDAFDGEVLVGDDFGGDAEGWNGRYDGDRDAGEVEGGHGGPVEHDDVLALGVGRAEDGVGEASDGKHQKRDDGPGAAVHGGERRGKEAVEEQQDGVHAGAGPEGVALGADGAEESRRMDDDEFEDHYEGKVMDGGLAEGVGPEPGDEEARSPCEIGPSGPDDASGDDQAA